MQKNKNFGNYSDKFSKKLKIMKNLQTSFLKNIKFEVYY